MARIVGQTADEYADNDCRYHREDRNGAVLTIQEGHGAFEDQIGDFLHRLGALVLRKHTPRQP